MLKTRGNETSTNLTLIKNIIIKMFDESFPPHLNLSTSNIYFNQNNNEVYLGPVKILGFSEYELYYSPPELALDSENISNYSNADVWSIGCILAELFFLASPLFACFSIRDKIRKTIEILGIPKYSDISFYMGQKEYQMIVNTYSNNKTEPLIFQLLEYKTNSVKKEVFNIIMRCLQYNPSNRPSIKELFQMVKDLENILKVQTNRSHFTHSLRSKTIPIEKSDTSNIFNKNMIYYNYSADSPSKQIRNVSNIGENTNNTNNKQSSLSYNSQNSNKDTFNNNKEKPTINTLNTVSKKYSLVTDQENEDYKMLNNSIYFLI
jgi:serine/threonine protein kinase